MATVKNDEREGHGYYVRIGFALPRSMAEELDHLLLRDGRRQGEYLRGLVAQAIREDRQHTLASRAAPSAMSPASRPADPPGQRGRPTR